MAIGKYEAVWLFVGFDLPTLSKEDRKRANSFRKALLDNGFVMFQLSFYSRYFPSKQQALSIANKVKTMVPINGKVSVFYITDMQYSMIETFYGGREIENIMPESAILLD